MKTPMQKLFEKLEAREAPISTQGVIWESIKHNFFLAEEKAMADQYWKGYKEGQFSGDKTAEESYNEEYKVSPQDTPTVLTSTPNRSVDVWKELFERYKSLELSDPIAKEQIDKGIEQSSIKK